MSIRVTHLVTYPLKSARGVPLDNSPVSRRGLQFDRQWALVDDDGAVVTAREHPKLLGLQPKVSGAGLEVAVDGTRMIEAAYPGPDRPLVPVRVFDEPANGVEVDASVNRWFSEYLGTSCRLVYMDPRCHREVLPENGGQPGDAVGYADACPLLLLSSASVADLNRRLSQPVTFRNFRPNVLVDGCAPYTEDEWRSIQIGECLFDIIEHCQRCVFTTIDPDTHLKHERQEPLRTLSAYRRHPDGGVAFGVYLIPRQTGTLRAGDEVRIA